MFGNTRGLGHWHTLRFREKTFVRTTSATCQTSNFAKDSADLDVEAIALYALHASLHWIWKINLAQLA